MALMSALSEARSAHRGADGACDGTDVHRLGWSRSRWLRLSAIAGAALVGVIVLHLPDELAILAAAHVLAGQIGCSVSRGRAVGWTRPLRTTS
jgi:hypothetical protein